MNDLKIEHNRAELTIDENEGGIVIKLKETMLSGIIAGQAQIWLDTRAILRLYAFLRDVIPDSEDLNGQEID